MSIRSEASSGRGDDGAVDDHPHRAGNDGVDVVDDGPGRDRGVRDPSGSYARSANPFERDLESGRRPGARKLGAREREQDQADSNAAPPERSRPPCGRSLTAML